MQIEQAARKPASPPCARHRDGENFSFIGGATRKNKTDVAAPTGGAVGDHVAVGQKLLEFLLAAGSAKPRVPSFISIWRHVDLAAWIRLGVRTAKQARSSPRGQYFRMLSGT